jgi:hypothetical protein
MNKNGVIAVVVVVVAIVLIGLWAMRSGQQNTSGRMDCNNAPAAPSGLGHDKKGDLVMLNWTAATGTEPVSTYIVEAGNSPGGNNVGVFVVPGSATRFERQAPPGTYYTRVLARNGCGTSAPSNEVVVTIP